MNPSIVRKLHEETLAVMVAKNEDYGTKNIAQTGIEGVAVRLIDKMQRILNITRKGGEHAVADEDVRKTFVDVTNYGLIGMMLVDGTWEQVEQTGVVYLAGPIDAVGGNAHPEATVWRENATEGLMDMGYGVFNPATAYRFPHKPDAGNSKALSAINRQAIASCDAVLVYLPSYVTSVGTIREIEYARQKGKPVLIWTEDRQYAVKLKNYSETRDCHVFEYVSEALAWLARTFPTAQLSR